MSFQPGLLPPAELDLPQQWILFSGDRIVLTESGDFPISTDQTLPPAILTSQLYLGHTNLHMIFTGILSTDTHLNPALRLCSIRDMAVMPWAQQQLLIIAKHIAHWNQETQYCYLCGFLLSDSLIERAKRCTHCDKTHYPPVVPAAIVLVYHGDKLLLARAPHFPEGMYSLVAGFVEPGETAEACAIREVKEEVGITIQTPRYQFSQAWPFPNSLMLGFLAEYDSGEINIDNEEIIAAEWFSKQHLPDRLPSQLSISRQLIDNFLNSLD